MNYVAFAAHRLISSGELPELAVDVRRHLDSHPDAPILIFDAHTSECKDLDLRGDVTAVRKRYTVAGLPTVSGPGRPKLGVVSREISLLPRHWEWLATQPGGASATLRRLVDQARKQHELRDALRAAQTATYKFMLVMAGDRPGYEDALRALYAGDEKSFGARIARWPKDIQAHTLQLASKVFAQ